MTSPDAKNTNCIVVDHEDHSKNVWATSKMKLPQFDLNLAGLSCQRTALGVHGQSLQGRFETTEPGSRSVGCVVGGSSVSNIKLLAR